MHLATKYLKIIALLIFLIILCLEKQTFSQINNFPIPDWLKGSNIFSADAIPDNILQQTRTSVVSWGGGGESFIPSRFKNLENKIKHIHQKGIKYCSSLPPISLPDYILNSFPELLPAISVDINGNAFMYNATQYKLCTNNPVWIDLLTDAAKTSIDLGADGIHFDEIYGSVFADCFCEACKKGFRTYLADKYTTEDLRNKYNIVDIRLFDYQKYIIENGFKDKFINNDKKWEIPLYEDYRQFQESAVIKIMKNTIHEIKKYAFDQYGRIISFSANINDLNPIGLRFTDDLDLFALEYFYNERGYPPVGKTTSLLKLARSIDNKQGMLMTSVGTSADLVKRSKTSNLCKIFIAEAYAALGSFIVPYEIYGSDGSNEYSFKADINAISPYYEFIGSHPVYYENLDCLANVGLLYTYDYDWQKKSFYGAAYALSDLQVQFDVVFCGDEKFLHKPLSLSQLEKYKVIILPSSGRILEQDFETIISFIKSGGKVIGLGNLNLTDANGNQSNNAQFQTFKNPGVHKFGTGSFSYYVEDFGKNYQANRIFSEISGFSTELDTLLMQKPLQSSWSATRNLILYQDPSSKDLILHCLNYNYNIQTDEVTPEDSISVILNVPEAQTYEHAFLSSPDNNLYQEIPFNVKQNLIRLTLSKLTIYNVLYLTKRNSDEITVMGKNPSGDSTVVAGKAITLSVDINSNSRIPLHYKWYINDKLDSFACSNSYIHYRDKLYDGTDVIRVNVSNGFQNLDIRWQIKVLKYKNPKILFDESHTERNSLSFSRAKILDPTSPEIKYLGVLKSTMDKSFSVDSCRESFLTKISSKYDAIILWAPDKEITQTEAMKIQEFVWNGGGLLFVGDADLWNDSVNRLLNRFGITYNNALLVDNGAATFNVFDFIEHSALGDRPIYLPSYGSSYRVTPPASAIAYSDSSCWFEHNYNYIHDQNEEYGKFVLICISNYGNGRILCLPDNSFSDMHLNSWNSPNLPIFTSSIEWVSENANRIVTSAKNNLLLTKSYHLSQSFPNPFNSKTSIVFVLPKYSHVSVSLFNLYGQKVKTIIDKTLSAGTHKFDWDGTDESGISVASGVYFYFLKTGDFSSYKKCLLLK